MHRSLYFISLTFSLLLPCGLSAQAAEMFPADRMRELREEIVYTPPETTERPAASPFPTLDLSDLGWPILFLGGSLLLALLLLLAYLLVQGIRRMENRRPPQVEEGIAFSEIVEEQLVEEGVSPDLIARAEAAGQYDVAVRLLYIASLRQLNDAGLIRYRKDRSNRDYRQQLSGHFLQAGFRECTRGYERYWYGQYPLGEAEYGVVRDQFRTLTDEVSDASPQSVAK